MCRIIHERSKCCIFIAPNDRTERHVLPLQSLQIPREANNTKNDLSKDSPFELHITATI